MHGTGVRRILRIAVAAACCLAGGACGERCTEHVDTRVTAGAYAATSDSADQDYDLVVSDDRRTVTESFVRDGVRYNLTYEVTAPTTQ